jgi:DNA invertase Pin-like site-specific DNA recombinase
MEYFCQNKVHFCVVLQIDNKIKVYFYKGGSTTMEVAYIRVSTIDQNEARQMEAMQRYPIEKWFVEKVSGKDTNRPELQKMLEFVREGDVVHVHDFSRLARSTKDLLQIVELLDQKGVGLVSNKESVDTSTPTGKLMLTMIGAIAEFERTNLLERQREGIAIAKQNGIYKGRKKIHIENFSKYYERYQNRRLTKTALAKELGISRPALNKLIAAYEKTLSKGSNLTP